MSEKQVVIVGAGLAGLSCALRLQERGISCRLYEKSDCVGGRVRTHVVDGYRMDRGFQVLLTAYPITQQTVDFGALELKSFYPGALVRFNGKFQTLGDPMRRPGDALATVFSSIGSLSDKTRMLHVRSRVMSGTLDELMARPEVTTKRRLEEFGFSGKMIQQFFKPFLGGIFLEPELITSSRKFEFVMRMFSEGEAALPKQGMQAIPQQMANRLKSDVLQSGVAVKLIEGNCLTLENGQRVTADVVVLATTSVEAGRLRAQAPSGRNASVTCLYYSADVSPVRGPWLVLNGDGTGPINNLCVPSELHPNYAPAGKSLVSVTVLGIVDDPGKLDAAVRTQLTEWYGDIARQWTHLRTYAIPEALIIQEPPLLEHVNKPVRMSDRLFACGDYLAVTSIEGAISTGIRCANEIAG
jgi:phytoene dehydrogenase-like protein